MTKILNLFPKKRPLNSFRSRIKKSTLFNLLNRNKKSLFNLVRSPTFIHMIQVNFYHLILGSLTAKMKNLLKCLEAGANKKISTSKSKSMSSNPISIKLKRVSRKKLW